MVMVGLNYLKDIFGNKCTSVKNNYKSGPVYNCPVKPKRFCESIAISFKSSLAITNENINCEGPYEVLDLKKTMNISSK